VIPVDRVLFTDRDFADLRDQVARHAEALRDLESDMREIRGLLGRILIAAFAAGASSILGLALLLLRHA